MSRRVATALSVVSIGLSVFLLLGIEAVRTGARRSFAGTVSGTDLIVGARGGSLQLLLYAVFGIGSATNNIDEATWRRFAGHRAVGWTIPISLGDSHHGYRVVATNEEFYRRYRYRGEGRIVVEAGTAPAGTFEAAVGSEVARKLGYRPGARIVLMHGVSATGFAEHGDRPFRVTAVLGKTGTPVDRSVYITLDGMDAIHEGWEEGAPPVEDGAATAGRAKGRQITAFLVGTRSRIDVLRLQREVNNYEGEPLMATIPGVALAEMWSLLGYAEQALYLVAGCVLATGLMSMLAVLYSTLNERRRELAVFRALGMSRALVSGLLVVEAQVCAAAGFGMGLAVEAATVLAARGVVEREFAIVLEGPQASWELAAYFGAVVVAATVAGALPAVAAYRRSLADGLAVRV